MNRRTVVLIVGILLLIASGVIAPEKMYLYDAKGRRIHMFEVGVELGKIVGSCSKKDVSGTINALEGCKKLAVTRG